ncbi:MAG: hypothetical protein LBJ47_09165, partial [Tannerella sp.]|nr:hypothetical protein [Tannerella sp.]
MEGRKQHIEHLSGPSAQGVELRAMSGMWTFMEITENGLTAIEQEKDGLLENILSPLNLNQAYKQVKRNKGSNRTALFLQNNRIFLHQRLTSYQPVRCSLSLLEQKRLDFLQIISVHFKKEFFFVESRFELVEPSGFRIVFRKK